MMYTPLVDVAKILGGCSKIICREFCNLFIVSKLLNWSNSKTIQLLHEKKHEELFCYIYHVLQENF